MRYYCKFFYNKNRHLVKSIILKIRTLIETQLRKKKTFVTLKLIPVRMAQINLSYEYATGPLASELSSQKLRECVDRF